MAFTVAVACGASACGASPPPEPSAASGAVEPDPTVATPDTEEEPAMGGDDGGAGATDPAGACSALIAVINRGVEDLQSTQASGGDATHDLRAMAAVMERVAREANEVPIADDELAGLAAAYRTMAERVARGAVELADAADAHDATKVGEAERRLNEAVEAEDSLVDRINVVCQGP